MKRKVFAIFLTAFTVLTIGISAAYYNTKTFGFDENAKIFSRDKEKISFLDYEIYYKDIDDFVVRAREYLPEKPTVICCQIHHNVPLI